VSDFRHNVITPSLLLMSECLTRLPIAGPRDVSSALFISALMLHFIAQSKRFIPELPAFLNAILLAGFGSVATPSSEDESISSNRNGSSTRRSSIAVAAEARLLLLTFRPGCQIWQNSFKSVTPSTVSSKAAKKGSKAINGALSTSTSLKYQSIFPESNNDDMYKTPTFALSSLLTLIAMIKQCSVLYATLPSYNELFGPIAASLQSLVSDGQLPLSSSSSPSSITDAVKSLITIITNGCTSSVRQRLPLYEKAKPVAIKQATPAFLESFTPGFDADKERAEIKKLNTKLKREKKGALRSIRGDNNAIAVEREKQEALRKVEELAQRKQWRANLDEEAVIIQSFISHQMCISCLSSVCSYVYVASVIQTFNARTEGRKAKQKLAKAIMNKHSPSCLCLFTLSFLQYAIILLNDFTRALFLGFEGAF
jgi:nucleolar protein 14